MRSNIFKRVNFSEGHNLPFMQRPDQIMIVTKNLEK